MITMFLIDIENNHYDTVKIGDTNEVEEIRKHLNCSHFELAVRRIEGKPYGIYMDEEGRFADKPVSAISYTQGASGVFVEDLRGNLLIFNMPTQGANEQSLTNQDVSVIKSHLKAFSRGQLILTDFTI